MAISAIIITITMAMLAEIIDAMIIDRIMDTIHSIVVITIAIIIC